MVNPASKKCDSFQMFILQTPTLLVFYDASYEIHSGEDVNYFLWDKCDVQQHVLSKSQLDYGCERKELMFGWLYANKRIQVFYNLKSLILIACFLLKWSVKKEWIF